MASLNKVILIGHLGKDVETRYTAGGNTIANMVVATSESWKDKNTGDKEESTEWHKVTFFGAVADVCGAYLKKGSQVYIEGKIVTRKWQDKDGQNRYMTEIRGEKMLMLGRKEGSDSSKPAPARQAPAKSRDPFDGDLDDDIPF